MRRFSLLVISLLLLAFLAACSDDLPADQTGCKENPEDATATKYDLDNGCRYGDILPHHGAEGEGDHAEGGEHGETEGDHAEGEGEHAETEGDHAEGEEHTEAEGEGDHAEAEGDHAEGEGDHAEAEATAEAHE